jgi:predicted PurR-regulated permease PerM
LLVSFVPFLVYFMLSWQEHVRSQTVMLFKLETRNTAYVTLGMISAMIRTYIGGNFVVGLFLSAVSMVVFALMGLPYFYFIGILSGFLSLVPYLGVVLALVPPLASGIGQISSQDIFIVVASVFSLHLFALMFWGWLWGAWGLILAIPITAAMKIIFDHVERLRPYGAWLGE